MAKVTITNSDGDTTLTPEARQQIAQGLPARIFGVERLERAAGNTAAVNRAVQASFPKAMFVLLPVFALLTSVAWRRQQPRYPAHLYHALHVHAAVFGAMVVPAAVAGLAPTTVAAITSVAALVYAAWYALQSLHRVFGDSWPRTIAKAGAVGIVYSVSFFAASLLILAYAVATM